MNASTQQEDADSTSAGQAASGDPDAPAEAAAHGEDNVTPPSEPAPVPSHAENVRRALDLLYEHFPKAFIRKGRVRPLKVGVFDDLRGRIQDIEGLTVSKVRDAMRFYTSRLAYQLALQQKGARRIDLDGNECGEVDSEHVSFARERSERIRASRRKRLKEARSRDSGSPGSRQPQPAAETAAGPAAEASGAEPGSAAPASAGASDQGPEERGGSRVCQEADPASDPADGGHAGAGSARRRGVGMRSADQDDLKAGVAVLVQSSHGDSSSRASYVRGVISRTEKAGVMVTLQTGMTVSVSPERLKIELSDDPVKD